MIRVGVIGYGYWGPNLVRNFMDAPGSSVVAIADRMPERLALAHVRCPLARTLSDPQAMFDDPSIDAIAVARRSARTTSSRYARSRPASTCWLKNRSQRPPSRRFGLSRKRAAVGWCCWWIIRSLIRVPFARSRRSSIHKRSAICTVGPREISSPDVRKDYFKILDGEQGQWPHEIR